MSGKYIDNEEKELIESFNSVDFAEVKRPGREEQEKIVAAAQDFMNKETKMNIRIDSYELARIKEFARNEGLKYQTLVKSIVHKYITGQLVEKRKISS